MSKDKLHLIYTTELLEPSKEYLEDEIAYLVSEEGLTRKTAEEHAHMSFKESMIEDWNLIKEAIEDIELLFLEGNGGTWQGRYRILKTIKPREFLTILSAYEAIKIEENGFGRVTFTCMHHDSTDYMELRVVNKIGVDRYNHSGLLVGTSRKGAGEQVDYLTNNLRLRRRLGWV